MVGTITVNQYKSKNFVPIKELLKFQLFTMIQFTISHSDLPGKTTETEF